MNFDVQNFVIFRNFHASKDFISPQVSSISCFSFDSASSFPGFMFSVLHFFGSILVGWQCGWFCPRIFKNSKITLPRYWPLALAYLTY